MRNPATPAEWQLAVDAAKLALCFAEAQHYRLIVGCAGGVDAVRCEEILAAGAARGVHPAVDVVERFARACIQAAVEDPMEDVR